MQHVKNRLHMNAVVIQELRQDNMRLKRDLEQVKDTCNNIFSFMQSRLGNYTPPLTQRKPLEEIIPDFEVLKDALEGEFQHFAYEYMTNPIEASWKKLCTAKKNEYKSKYGKQVISMKTFHLFLEHVPEKPSYAEEIPEWEGKISQCINDGMKKLNIFLKENPELKSGRGRRVTVTDNLMSRKINIEFIEKKLKEKQEMLLGISETSYNRIVGHDSPAKIVAEIENTTTNDDEDEFVTTNNSNSVSDEVNSIVECNDNNISNEASNTVTITQENESLSTEIGIEKREKQLYDIVLGWCRPRKLELLKKMKLSSKGNKDVLATRIITNLHIDDCVQILRESKEEAVLKGGEKLKKNKKNHKRKRTQPLPSDLTPVYEAQC